MCGAIYLKDASNFCMELSRPTARALEGARQLPAIVAIKTIAFAFISFCIYILKILLSFLFTNPNELAVQLIRLVELAGIVLVLVAYLFLVIIEIYSFLWERIQQFRRVMSKVL